MYRTDNSSNIWTIKHMTNPPSDFFVIRCSCAVACNRMVDFELRYQQQSVNIKVKDVLSSANQRCWQQIYR